MSAMADPVTRADLEALGYSVPPEGGVATRVCGAELGERKSRPKPEPLAQSIIDGMVARFPLATKDPACCPRVIGCDPSINAAGFAEVGGPFGTVRVAEFRSREEWTTGEKVLALARFAEDFVQQGFGLPTVIVEGTYFRRTGDASAEAIQVYGEAVGAVIGALSRFEVIHVGPEWMPRILTGPNTQKEDRWNVAQGLVERAGWQWPEGTGHEWDACCLACAYLAQEGWL